MLIASPQPLTRYMDPGTPLGAQLPDSHYRLTHPCLPYAQLTLAPKFYFLMPPPNRPTDFYARQHICYSTYMPWQFRLSVRPSVTQVDQSKTVEARITQFSP